MGFKQSECSARVHGAKPNMRYNLLQIPFFLYLFFVFFFTYAQFYFIFRFALKEGAKCGIMF